MPLRSLIRVAAMYTVSGSPASPICMSTTAPCLYVCPCAACAVVANPGANGSCRRVTRSTGLPRPLSKYHGFRCGVTGKTLFSATPSTRQEVLVAKRTKMQTGNWFQMCVLPCTSPSSVLANFQPTTSPGHPPSRFPGRGPNGLWPWQACQCREVKLHKALRNLDHAVAARPVFLCPGLAFLAKRDSIYDLSRLHNAPACLPLRPTLVLSACSHDIWPHWWQKLLWHLQNPVAYLCLLL